MKKKWLVMVGAFLMSSTLWAQQLPRQAISTAGNNSTAGGLSLSWTVGQSGPVESVSPSSFYITQGYQQGDEWWVSINGLVVANTAIKVFPNPSVGLFHIEGTLPSGGKCQYQVTDLQGKLVMSDYFTADADGNFQSSFNISFLANGSYMLMLSGGAGSNLYICSNKLTLIK